MLSVGILRLEMDRPKHSVGIYERITKDGMDCSVGIFDRFLIFFVVHLKSWPILGQC